eukprot:6196788-Pleurochrysis_carterae.AAC.7
MSHERFLLEGKCSRDRQWRVPCLQSGAEALKALVIVEGHLRARFLERRMREDCVMARNRCSASSDLFFSSTLSIHGLRNFNSHISPLFILAQLFPVLQTNVPLPVLSLHLSHTQMKRTGSRCIHRNQNATAPRSRCIDTFSNFLRVSKSLCGASLLPGSCPSPAICPTSPASELLCVGD